MSTLLMLPGRQWNWYMQFICRRNTEKCSRLCAPEVTQNILPGINIFIFKLYFTSSQTIIHYSQEELHLRSYYAFTKDRTEDMAFSLSFLYFVYKYKVVIMKSRQPSFSLQKECRAYLWKLLMNFYTPFLFLSKETDSRIRRDDSTLSVLSMPSVGWVIKLRVNDSSPQSVPFGRK